MQAVKRLKLLPSKSTHMTFLQFKKRFNIIMIIIIITLLKGQNIFWNKFHASNNYSKHKNYNPDVISIPCPRTCQFRQPHRRRAPPPSERPSSPRPPLPPWRSVRCRRLPVTPNRSQQNVLGERVVQQQYFVNRPYYSFIIHVYVHCTHIIVWFITHYQCDALRPMKRKVNLY